MNIEDRRKMVINVIDNEFNHISEFKENNDFNNDNELNKISEKINDILNKLNEILPEQQDLIEELDNLHVSYCISACKYYFKEGIVAGTTNLKFLEETKIMHLI